MLDKENPDSLVSTCGERLMAALEHLDKLAKDKQGDVGQGELGLNMHSMPLTRLSMLKQAVLIARCDHEERLRRFIRC